MSITVHELVPLLEVFDLPASLRFYRDLLGFDLVSGDETSWCMLELSGVRLMLNTAYEEGKRPSEPLPSRVRGHGDTSLYFSSPDPDAVYAHLSAHDWPVDEPTVTSYGVRQVSTLDPDGFRLHFVCPA